MNTTKKIIIGIVAIAVLLLLAIAARSVLRPSPAPANVALLLDSADSADSPERKLKALVAAEKGRERSKEERKASRENFESAVARFHNGGKPKSSK